MIENIEYSTKPVTLRDMILIKRVANEDVEAILECILSRTNLTEEQAMALDTEDLKIVIENIGKAIQDANRLSQLGNQLRKL